jgi:2-succinyl-6-hydroxy-2,4-cyclohexadiene-1-carboxylate synthase
VLRGFGAGAMQPLWPRLPELEMPVTVLAGDRDPTYHAIGRCMVELLPHARLELVAGGHRLLLENPEAVARALQGPDAEAGG